MCIRDRVYTIEYPYQVRKKTLSNMVHTGSYYTYFYIDDTGLTHLVALNAIITLGLFLYSLLTSRFYWSIFNPPYFQVLKFFKIKRIVKEVYYPINLIH